MNTMLIFEILLLTLSVLVLTFDASLLSGSPLDDSAYYWSMKTFVRNPEGEEVTRDVKAEEELILFNGVEKTKTEDLGQVLVLDGKKSWISLSTTKTENLLILKKSLTLGFWMKYESGDTIMAAGAYVDALRSPGFRLRRDKKTNFFFLDVKGSSWSGRVVIERFPTNWFHFLFTWDKENGLKLYIDGKHMLSSKGRSGDFSYSEKRSGLNKLQFGRSRHHMYTRGNFSLGHVVIWDEALDADRVKSVYKTSIILTRHKMCCYLKQHTCHRNVSEYEGCICSKHDEYLQKHIDTKCKPATLTDLNAFCGDESDHCDILIKGQEGYCTNFRSYAKKSCRSSCEIPCIRTVPLVGPSKHFTEKTLIFSILGCIGGLMLLLGVTVYFWKVYRTRCHGSFVPPSKSTSLLDVTVEYDDEKWPNKFVDSNAFYIKDVPPKKRALPLIPAKNSQSNYRYQPPEFD